MRFGQNDKDDTNGECTVMFGRVSANNLAHLCAMKLTEGTQYQCIP